VSGPPKVIGKEARTVVSEAQSWATNETAANIVNPDRIVDLAN